MYIVPLCGWRFSGKARIPERMLVSCSCDLSSPLPHTFARIGFTTLIRYFPSQEMTKILQIGPKLTPRMGSPAFLAHAEAGSARVQVSQNGARASGLGCGNPSFSSLATSGVTFILVESCLQFEAWEKKDTAQDGSWRDTLGSWRQTGWSFMNHEDKDVRSASQAASLGVLWSRTWGLASPGHDPRRRTRQMPHGTWRAFVKETNRFAFSTATSTSDLAAFWFGPFQFQDERCRRNNKRFFFLRA